MAQEYGLTGLSVNEANVILAGLLELPLKVAGEVYSKVAAQFNAASQPVEITKRGTKTSG